MPRKLRIGYPRAIRISGDPGTYTLTGQNASTIRASIISAAQGSYSLSGQDATLSTSAASDMTLSLAVSRSSGPAPLAINVYGVGTTVSGQTSAEVFRKNTYLFEVQSGGVTVSGTYANGLARYSQSGGPVAAFNILSAGTYTVKMTVTKGIPWSAPATREKPYLFLVGDIVTYNGNTYTCATQHNQSASIVPGVHGNWTLTQSGLIQSTTTSSSITVTAQDAYFAGTNTICVNGTGSNDGEGPSGCLYAATAGTIQTGKRYLHKRAGTYANITVPMGVSDVCFGAYGTGAKPIVNRISGAESSSLSTWPHTVIVQDLAMQRVGQNTCPLRWTIYNCDINRSPGSGTDAMVDIGTTTGFYYDNGSQPNSAFFWPRENFLFENTITGTLNGGDSPNITVMGIYNKSGIVGNTINRADEFSIRMFLANLTFVGHNTIGGEAQNSGKGAVKVHSFGNAPAYADSIETTGTTFPGGSLSATGGAPSNHLVFADNVVGSVDADNVDWTVGVGPQNLDSPVQSPPYGTVEFNSYHIWERNSFIRGALTSQDLHFTCGDTTSRFNVADTSEFNGDVVNPGEYPAPNDSNGFDYGRRIMPNNCGPYYGQLT